ncbi:MAG: sulfotransferase domain-containing protein, partial [Gammaproteobacteria bacterium]
MGGIVWLASYPKSGNTWIRAFLGNYLANADKPVSLARLSLSREFLSAGHSTIYSKFSSKNVADMSDEELAEIRPQAHRSLASQRAGRVFVKCHSFLGDIFGVPAITGDVTAGAIYVVRNPLDVCCSFARHMGSSVDDTIELMNSEGARLVGTPEAHGQKFDHAPEYMHSWSENVRSWTEVESAKICVLQYEDLLLDPAANFARVIRFLDMDLDDERLARSISFSSIEKLRKQESEEGFAEASPHTDGFFGQGTAGQWEEVLTNDQVRRLVDN